MGQGNPRGHDQGGVSAKPSYLHFPHKTTITRPGAPGSRARSYTHAGFYDYAGPSGRLPTCALVIRLSALPIQLLFTATFIRHDHDHNFSGGDRNVEESRH